MDGTCVHTVGQRRPCGPDREQCRAQQHCNNSRSKDSKLGLCLSCLCKTSRYVRASADTSICLNYCTGWYEAFSLPGVRVEQVIFRFPVATRFFLSKQALQQRREGPTAVCFWKQFRSLLIPAERTTSIPSASAATRKRATARRFCTHMRLVSETEDSLQQYMTLDAASACKTVLVRRQ